MDIFSQAIKKEIFDLIALKTEGGYWDFKEMWSDNKTDLLHDIICMANNLENRDAYIIIGVRDSKDSKGFAVVGINIEDKNRRDQEKLITFLRDKNFVGMIRPIVYLFTMEYTPKVLIDVIIIKNTTNTPYYLSTQFGEVRVNNIYTRIGDTNTPKDKSADIDKVEHLWKKRFGINLTPLEKIKFLLRNPQDWRPVGTDGKHSSSKYRNQWHHKQFPEFIIQYEMDKGIYNKGKIDEIDADYYWMKRLCRPLHNTYIYELEVKYFSTVLYSGLAIFADNYRFNRIQWSYNCISYDNINFLRYSYIEKDSLEFLLDNWLFNSYETTDETISCNVISSLNPWKREPEYTGKNNPYTVVPVFENKDEHDNFIEYVKLNKDKIIEKVGLYKKQFASDPEYIDYLCNIGETLVCLLKDWRKNII